MCMGDRSAQAGVGGFAGNAALVEEEDDVEAESEDTAEDAAEARGRLQLDQPVEQRAALTGKQAETEIRQVQHVDAHLQIWARAIAG